MKRFFFLFGLLAPLAGCPVAHAQGNPQKAQVAYAAQVKALFKESGPVLRDFGALLSKQGKLHGELSRHVITPQQYKAQQSKPQEWLPVIARVRVETGKFANLKAVPPSMRAVNSHFADFSHTMDKSLTVLTRWTSSHKEADLESASGSLRGAFASLIAGVRLMGPLMGQNGMGRGAGMGRR